MYTLSRLEQNGEALTVLEAGGRIDPATWVVRTGKDDLQPFTLTGAHFAALAFNERGDCFEGELAGEELFVEFYAF